MTAKNDVTGDEIATKYNSSQYVNNWDAIFGKKKTEDKDTDQEQKEVDSEEEPN